MTPQAQTSERERHVRALRQFDTIECSKPNDLTAARDLLVKSLRIHEADAEKIRALEAKVELLQTTLRKCRDGFAQSPHSLGYEYTHLPIIDAALAATQSPRSEAGDGLPEVMSPNEYPLYLQNIDD